MYVEISEAKQSDGKIPKQEINIKYQFQKHEKKQQRRKKSMKYNDAKRSLSEVNLKKM